MDSAQGSDLAPIFGDLNNSGKLSEIKPPLWQKLRQMSGQIGIDQSNIVMVKVA